MRFTCCPPEQLSRRAAIRRSAVARPHPGQAPLASILLRSHDEFAARQSTFAICDPAGALVPRPRGPGRHLTVRQPGIVSACGAWMRVLLVYPAFPTTYWGFQHSLPLVGRRATLPPLGLISVAALLPPERNDELRLVDLNVEPLSDEALRWADVVLTGGMLVQEESLHGILARARALGRRTLIG